jgi:hypothetical protein
MTLTEKQKEVMQRILNKHILIKTKYRGLGTESESFWESERSHITTRENLIRTVRSLLDKNYVTLIRFNRYESRVELTMAGLKELQK